MPFVKGQSGNPGGRAKGLGDIRALAQSHSKKALGVLVAALDDDDARVRVKAAEALLDRGYGKPAQSLEHSGELVMSLTGVLEALPVVKRDDREDA